MDVHLLVGKCNLMSSLYSRHFKRPSLTFMKFRYLSMAQVGQMLGFMLSIRSFTLISPKPTFPKIVGLWHSTFTFLAL
jgi:hypothetical protein